MDKDEIRRLAYRRMATIEERHCDRVPPEVQSYWLTCYLIGEGFKAYFNEYGLLPIHVRDANDGRQQMGWGPLSLFEKDTITLLRHRIEDEERTFRSNRRISLISNSADR